MTDNELLLQISNIVSSNTKYLEFRIDQLDEKIASVEQRLSARIDSVSNDVKRISMYLENNIEPRLQTIESCYVDTSRRHNASIEKIDKLQIDMEVVQSVLKDHIAFINKQTA